MEDPLTDPTWNKDNPRWLRATVWAAQFAAWGWLQAGYPASYFPEGHRLCGACAAEVPHGRGGTRCSKCKTVPSPAVVCSPLSKPMSVLLSLYYFAVVLLWQRMPAESTPHRQALVPSACAAENPQNNAGKPHISTHHKTSHPSVSNFDYLCHSVCRGQPYRSAAMDAASQCCNHNSNFDVDDLQRRSFLLRQSNFEKNLQALRCFCMHLAGSWGLTSKQANFVMAK